VDGLRGQSHDAVSCVHLQGERNVAPWGRFAVAHSRPPWASMIASAYRESMPMPLDLWVKRV